MASKLVRKNGLLFEEAEEPSLLDKVSDAGLATPPTTPFAAQAVPGATPKQVDMAGTPAQKKPVLEQAVAKQDTLAGAQRLEAPRAQATTAEESAANRAQQLAQVGSLSSRVQTLIEQELKKAATTQVGQAQISGDSVSQMLGPSPEALAAQKAQPNSQYNQVVAKLQQYAANPSNEQLLVELTQLGVTPAQAQQASTMFQGGAEATGGAVANAAADNVTMGQVDIGAMGYSSPAELAAVMGIPEAQLTAMTVPQFQQAVQSLQASTFDRVKQLKIQVATLPPGSAQRQIAERELRDLGQVGVTGTEQRAAKTAREISTADQVTVGGRTMSVGDMMKDKNISNLVQAYLTADPEYRDQLLPPDKFGDLRQWVDANYQALGELQQSAQATQKTFGTAQEQYAALGETGGVKIAPEVLAAAIPGYQPGQVVTSAQAAAAQQALAATPLGQLAQSDIPNKAIVVSAITPDILAAMTEKGWSADQIAQSFDAAEKLRNSTLASELLGLDEETGPFMMDESKWGQVDNAVGIGAAIEESGDSSLASSDSFKDLVADGSITAENAAEWAQFPEALKDDEVARLISQHTVTLDNAPQLLADIGAKLDAHSQEASRIAATQEATDIGALVTALFGGNKTVAQLNDTYGSALELKKLGDTSVNPVLSQFLKLDKNRDGTLDNSDVDSIKAGLQKNADPLVTFLERGPDVGQSLFSKFQDIPNTLSDQQQHAADSYRTITNYYPSVLDFLTARQGKKANPMSAVASIDAATNYLKDLGIDNSDLELLLAGDRNSPSRNSWYLADKVGDLTTARAAAQRAMNAETSEPRHTQLGEAYALLSEAVTRAQRAKDLAARENYINSGQAKADEDERKRKRAEVQAAIDEKAKKAADEKAAGDVAAKRKSDVTGWLNDAYKKASGNGKRQAELADLLKKVAAGDTTTIDKLYTSREAWS